MGHWNGWFGNSRQSPRSCSRPRVRNPLMLEALESRDLMSARPNLAPHQYSQYFHFEGDVEISPQAPASGLPLRGSHDDANVLIVIAGMEGALPSVVGGLVDKPVIAVPTSVGYGASFGGIAALLAMLNSCASGVTVVNINNGFGAGYAASLINHLPSK